MGPTGFIIQPLVSSRFGPVRRWMIYNQILLYTKRRGGYRVRGSGTPVLLRRRSLLKGLPSSVSAPSLSLSPLDRPPPSESDAEPDDEPEAEPDDEPDDEPDAEPDDESEWPPSSSDWPSDSDESDWLDSFRCLQANHKPLVPRETLQ